MNHDMLHKDWELLHQMPEEAFRERNTSAYIRDRMKGAGFRVSPVADTGLLCCLEGQRPGPTVALRADLDALLLTDVEGHKVLDHACGHDAHCAMVMAAASAIAAEGLPRGVLLALFQPAEETLRGAQAVITEGLPPIDGMFGIHLRPANEMRPGLATPALYHCAAIHLDLCFYGKAAHGARPHLGINAISTAAKTIAAVDALELDTAESWSAKATMIDSGGNLQNVIPDFCSVTFDLRAQSNQLAQQLEQLVRQAGTQAANASGARLEIRERARAYAPRFDERLVAISAQAIQEVLGEAQPPMPTLGSEDFHSYGVCADIPSAYIGLGAGVQPGLHVLGMTFDHQYLDAGAEILRRCALTALEELPCTHRDL